MYKKFSQLRSYAFTAGKCFSFDEFVSQAFLDTIKHPLQKAVSKDKHHSRLAGLHTDGLRGRNASTETSLRELWNLLPMHSMELRLSLIRLTTEMISNQRHRACANNKQGNPHLLFVSWRYVVNKLWHTQLSTFRGKKRLVWTFRFFCRAYFVLEGSWVISVYTKHPTVFCRPV